MTLAERALGHDSTEVIRHQPPGFGHVALEQGDGQA